MLSDKAERVVGGRVGCIKLLFSTVMICTQQHIKIFDETNWS